MDPFPLNVRSVTEPFHSPGQAGLGRKSRPLSYLFLCGLLIRGTTLSTPSYTQTCPPPFVPSGVATTVPARFTLRHIDDVAQSFSHILRGRDPICPTEFVIDVTLDSPSSRPSLFADGRKIILGSDGAHFFVIHKFMLSSDRLNFQKASVTTGKARWGRALGTTARVHQGHRKVPASQ